MPLKKKSLLDFLEILDGHLDRKITLVAAGGTAMTLLDLKPSTIDIDFTIPHEDKRAYDKAIAQIQHGYKIDIWLDGSIFSQNLPDDYLEKSIPIANFKHIQLKALHPLDIIVTKIGRLDERDIEDTESCLNKFKISKNKIKKRAATIEYTGNPENYNTNLQYVLKRFFK